MAKKAFWVGTTGPFYFDDDEPQQDASGTLLVGTNQAAIITEGQLRVLTAPVFDDEVLRLEDVGVNTGDVVGPAGATDNALARFDGATGKLLQDSGVILLDANLLGVGIAAPTAVLHLQAGTAAAGTGQVKFEESVLLTTPETGVLEFSAGRLYLTNLAHRRALDRTSDVAVATVTVENTTTETTLWTGNMDANSLKPGNVFKLHCDGVVQNGGPTAADQITIRVKVGGVTKLTLTPTTKTLAAGTEWHIDANATQRTIGATGSRAMHLHLEIGDAASTGDEVSLVGVGSIDTTANMDVTVTAQWASADAANIISLYQGFMEYKN